MKYKHIFFDLDRTLWDFDKAADVAFEKIFTKYHLDTLGIPTPKEFHDVYQPYNDMLWKRYRENSITKEELCIQRFHLPLLHYGIDDIDLCQNLSDDYVLISPRIVQLIPHAIEVLEYLQTKYALHIITNGFQETQDTKMKTADMLRYFTSITVSEEAGVKKPDKGIFSYALAKANAKPEESLMIGDEMEVDIIGARNAGIDQVFYNRKQEKHLEDTTFEISSLAELKDLL